MEIKQNNRILNLDLFRSFAIIFVLYFHISQMILGDYFNDKNIFIIGKYGVNMFFVLSGFLIGGMFYRDKQVNAFKFWIKRFLRTYPPYLVVLLVSWLAVWISRKEHFDVGYLFMIQNFYPSIPYFLVSWSLCVEEHFYITFSILIYAIPVKRNQQYIWLFLAFAPSVMRFILGNPYATDFGYYTTATYFQIDGIALGVLASYYVYEKSFTIKSSNFLLIVYSLLFALCCYATLCFHGTYFYSFGNLIINLLTVITLLNLFFLSDLKMSKFAFFKLNARMAYSIYLTHPLCIHFCMLMYKYLSIEFLIVKVLITVLAVYLSSYIFYRAVEKPTILIRDKLLAKKLVYD
ncbi:acyltransferase family protein [Pedobacter jejuensis]|uniref:Acyltransferase n=1 Tax=Pedobacter jejuensis TaxID=1268550 RepID=A0A3N0BQT8_9SPHI|nr:acyltransferase [Pedobacter jejuensis]RNL51140.1 acyltransferase [Pedobacter jejuensis]